MYSLQIKRADWLKIFIFAIFFGSLFGSILYVLASSDMFQGAFIGILNGFWIACFAFLLISAGNNIILPNIDPKYWNFISFVLSFMAGFYGSIIAVYVAIWFDIEVIPGYYANFMYLSAVIGIITYLIGFVMYLFVNSRNHEEVMHEQYEKNRLMLLQLQLNPHFLYNILNSVAELVHKDATKAEKALMDLGRFFRNTLEQNLVVSIKDEILSVKNYISIENIRFGDNIVFGYDGSLLNFSNIFVPKFSIQLLVENSIKHNNPARKKIHINLEVYKNQNSLEISVKDDGKGFSEMEFGIGLKNLAERLSVLHKGFLEAVDGKNGAFFKMILKENYENIGN